MERLIEEIEIYKRLRSKVDNGTLDEIMLDIPTVEAIPKADYENRLKTDMVAILTEIQLEIEEEKRNTKHLHYDDLENAESYNTAIDNCIDTIQQKIDKYRAENEE